MNANLIPGTIVKTVKVNRSRTNMEAVNATGRVQSLSNIVVEEMPTSTEEEMEIYFVPFKKTLSPSALEKAVDKVGCKLVDPVALCATNESDSEFADKYPNATQWRDKNGKVCYAAFAQLLLHKKRGVVVRQDEYHWEDEWFFGCVPK